MVQGLPVVRDYGTGVEVDQQNISLFVPVNGYPTLVCLSVL